MSAIKSVGKFIKGLGFMEWSIIIVIAFFIGLFWWSYSKPSTQEIQSNSVADSKLKVRVYEFWGQGCPHCAAAEPFLKQLDGEYEEMEVVKYEVYYNRQNQDKYDKVAKAFGKKAEGVPFFVIGDESFNGYDNAEGMGQELKNKVDSCLQNGCPDKAGEILGLPKLSTSSGNSEPTKNEAYKTISVSEAKTLISENQNNPDFVILDVRRPDEFSQQVIDQKAINLDVESPDFTTNITRMDPEKIYLVYCRTGNRSRQAAKVMTENGFNNVYNMDGGIIEWFNFTQTT